MSCADLVGVVLRPAAAEHVAAVENTWEMHLAVQLALMPLAFQQLVLVQHDFSCRAEGFNDPRFCGPMATC